MNKESCVKIPIYKINNEVIFGDIKISNNYNYVLYFSMYTLTVLTISSPFLNCEYKSTYYIIIVNSYLLLNYKKGYITIKE